VPHDAPLHPVDPHGEVALMLCESLLHVLVEADIISKEKALEVIQIVVEVTRETAGDDQNADAGGSAPDRAAMAAGLAESIFISFAAKSPR
jgi:hypothetical protein